LMLRNWRIQNKEENKMETMEYDIENIPDVESGSGIDLEQFAGQRTKIAAIKQLEVETHFDENGDYNENLKRKTMVLKVESEPVTEFKGKDGKTVKIKASELFNMKKNEQGVWGIPTAPKSKIRKFLARQKVKAVKDLMGTSVIIKDYVDKRTQNVYLGFVIE